MRGAFSRPLRDTDPGEHALDALTATEQSFCRCRSGRAALVGADLDINYPALMPSPIPTGSIEFHEWKDGRTVSWWLRVRFRGKRPRIPLGTNHEGWNRERAQIELDKILAKIERGTWEFPSPEEPGDDRPNLDETVYETLSGWWRRRSGAWEENTFNDYRWRMDHLLVCTIVHERTASLRVKRIDELQGELSSRVQLKGGKVDSAPYADGRTLAPRSVNMVLDLLAMALDDAVDYDLLAANPARGHRRRMKVKKKNRGMLLPDMLADMYDVAGEWEESVPEHQRYGRRPLLVLIGGAGPRIIEATEVTRGGYGIGSGELRTGRKTEAGTDRLFELSAFVTAELDAHCRRVRPRLLERYGPRLPLFHSAKGRPLNPSNIRNRLLAGVVERANERRAAKGKLLLPDVVTPHMLRRAFVSMCFWVGRDLKWTMGQVGHRDPRMTASVYAWGAQRKQLDYELVWKLMRFADEPARWAERHGPRHGAGPTAGPTVGRRTSTTRRRPHGRGRVRTSDLSRVKRALSH
jgi:integrase